MKKIVSKSFWRKKRLEGAVNEREFVSSHPLKNRCLVSSDCFSKISFSKNSDKENCSLGTAAAQGQQKINDKPARISPQFILLPFLPTYLPMLRGATHVQIIWLLTLTVAASSTSTSTSAWHGKAKQGEFKNHRKTLIATPKKSFRGQANLSRNILC